MFPSAHTRRRAVATLAIIWVLAALVVGVAWYVSDFGAAELRLEPFVLWALLLIVALGLYVYEHSAHVRRMTERAQSEARFASIVNTAMDAIIILTETFEVAMVNRAAEQMFGCSAHDAMGRSIFDLIPEDANETVRRTLENTLVTSEEHHPLVCSVERYAPGRRRDGSSFSMDLSVSQTTIDGHSHLTVVIRDVTAWRRAEETSEWQRRVLESIATGIDLQQVLASIARFHETQCPEVDCAIHLVDDDGVTLRFASGPSIRPEFIEAMDDLIIGPRSASCGTAAYRRTQIITRDIANDPLWSDYRAVALEQGYRSCWATPIRSPQGRLLGAMTVYTREVRTPSDHELRVTSSAIQLAGVAVDRAHAAESLRKSEASFRSFVENSPIGIYRASGAGRLLAVNDSLVKLLGYESSLELLQVDMARNLFVSAPDREHVVHQLETQGEVRSAEMEFRRKDRSAVAVRVSARAYRDERGAVLFSEGFVENVSALRAAEQALRQSEKLAALGQIVSGVAHELNNPLAAILHFAEDLLDDERGPDDLEALTMIRDQARRSRAIVRDLLSFGRSRDASRERIKLTDTLNASARAVRPVVKETGAILRTDLPSAEVWANADRAGLQQVVTNLVVNGAQASGRDGVISLRAEFADQQLIIVVEDSGPGIPPELMDRIFEPFFTTKPLGEGTGLGLSVTLGIVQQMGGKITVENRSEEGLTGARFIVTIPIDAGGRVEPSGSGALVGPAGPELARTIGPSPRVLLIDDEPSIRSALRRFFSRRGWRVDEAEDGAMGLSALLAARSDYAVVISDLKMPGYSGVELHDHIAAVAPELLDRIIFSTGDVASRDAAAFVRRTRCTVLQKPFELRALEALVGRMRQQRASA